MSLLTAQEFLECLERDQKLQKHFALVAPATIESILDFAAHHGYHFSEDDFTVALQAFPKSRLAQKYAGPELRLSPSHKMWD
ncbi:MAG: Nif11-like leader peptide family natural product precursor [Chloroflexota bacterium]